MQLVPDSEQFLAIVQFTAFLVRHLPAIAPNIVVVLFNDETSHLANHIASGLTGRVQTMVNSDYRGKHQTIAVQESALFISFLNTPSHLHFIQINPDSRGIKVVLNEKQNKTKPPEYISDILIVQAIRNPLLFTVSMTSNSAGERNTIMDESELMDSFAWKAFLRRVDKLPAGKSLMVTDAIQMDSSGVAVNGNNRETSDAAERPPTFVSGFRIGLYMILAERLSSNQMKYIGVPDSKSNRLMRYLDKRLSWRNSKHKDNSNDYVSLKHDFAYKVYTNSEPYRFVVLIPRVIVHDSSLIEVILKYLRKCLVVAGLLLIAAIFSALRYLCQRTTADSKTTTTSSVFHLFVDTFGRSIGCSAGAWLGRSRSERQLLVVIGVFAFLFGSIFSGSLFEQFLTKAPVQYLYNSLDDVCRAKLKVTVEQYVFKRIFYSESEQLSMCNVTFFVSTIRTTNGAIICDAERIKDIQMVSEKYIQLTEPFMVIPSAVCTTEEFLLEPFRRLIAGCVEHGIWSTLWSTAKHLETLDKARRELPTYDASEETVGDPHFEFFVLAIGLGVATIVFGVECLMKAKR